VSNDKADNKMWVLPMPDNTTHIHDAIAVFSKLDDVASVEESVSVLDRPPTLLYS
jgi:hypothetical protein